MADQGAKLISVGAIADFKVALVKFGEQAKVGLIEANSEMQRTMNRLNGELLAHWRHEEKRWARKTAEAKSELYRAQLASRDERPSVILERKAFEAAKHRLEEAQRKIQRIRYWSQMIEKEAMLCRGQLQQLDRILDAELPRVGAQLDRMMQAIEKYLKTRAPMSPVEREVEGEPGEAVSRSGGELPSEESLTMRPDQEPDEAEDSGTKGDRRT